MDSRKEPLVSLLHRHGCALVAVLLMGAFVACSPDAAEPVRSPSASTSPVEVLEGLRAELIEMQRQDQQERTGEGLPPGTRMPPMQDYSRTSRLKEMIEEYGWPTHSLVGEDGASAAWLVAQHADFDVDFQEEALTLMRAAQVQGQVDETEVAYLADRVAVNRGTLQTYGTQVRCSDGRPRPATPIEERAAVDERRVAVGMEPLADYFGELAMMCANEAAEGESAGP